MSDEVTTEAAPVIETTENNPQVSKPVVSPKPYDDDMMEAYEAQEDTPINIDTEVKEEPKPEEEAPQEAKATANDKVDDGVEDLPIKRQINGKEVEFKIKDAIQSYVKQEEFNRNMDKRITHISQREQKAQQREERWSSEQKSFKDVIGRLVAVAQEGDFVTAIRGIAKIAVGDSGKDVTEFEKLYFDQLDNVNNVYKKMTPDQREAYFAKRAAAEAKTRLKALEDDKSAAIENHQFQQKIVSLQKENGLSNDEFWSNYGAMEQSLVGPDKTFQSTSEITPEEVIKYSHEVRHWDKVLQAAQKAEIEDDAKIDEIARVTATMPELTVDEVVTIIKNASIVKTAPASAVENLNRKAGHSRFNQANSTRKEDGLDKEDLNFLYRNQPRTYIRAVR